MSDDLFVQHLADSVELQRGEIPFGGRRLQLCRSLVPAGPKLLGVKHRKEVAGRDQIADRCRSDEQPFLQKHRRPVTALAAAVLVAVGLLVLFRPTPPPVRPETQGPSTLGPTSLASLNAAFEEGGMEAIERLFQEFMKLKKPKPEIKSVEDAMNGESEKEN